MKNSNKTFYYLIYCHHNEKISQIPLFMFEHFLFKVWTQSSVFTNNGTYRSFKVKLLKDKVGHFGHGAICHPPSKTHTLINLRPPNMVWFNIMRGHYQGRLLFSFYLEPPKFYKRLDIRTWQTKSYNSWSNCGSAVKFCVGRSWWWSKILNRL